MSTSSKNSWLFVIMVMVLSISLVVGIYIIYPFDFSKIIRFISIAGINLSIFVLALLAAKHVAHSRTQVLTKAIKIDTDIKPDLVKGLVVKTETQSNSTKGSVTKVEKQIRLSEIEIDHIAGLFKNEVIKEVKKNFKAINDDFLTVYLFLFFVVGIVLFIVVMVVSFFLFKFQLQFVLTCLFDGQC